MAPEQVRGEPVGRCAPIYSRSERSSARCSTGTRAFRRETAADTMSCHPQESDPARAPRRRETVPETGSRASCGTCSRRSRRDRFQSASDLGFALESLAGSAGAGSASEEARAQKASALASGQRSRPPAPGVGRLRSGGRPTRVPAPLLSYKQLSFRRGMILDARFTTDGNTVVYGGLFDGTPAETYSIHLSGPGVAAAGSPTGATVRRIGVRRAGGPAGSARREALRVAGNARASSALRGAGTARGPRRRPGRRLGLPIGEGGWP